jgi:hypothetical protein
MVAMTQTSNHTIDATNVRLGAGVEHGPPSAARMILGLRTLLGVMNPDSPPPTSTLELLTALRERWSASGGVGSLPIIEQLQPLASDELEPASIEPSLRVQCVRLAIVAVLLEREPDLDRVARVERLAAHLGVAEPGVVDLRLWAERKHFRLRRHMIPRFWLFDELRARVAEQGLLKVIWIFVAWQLRLRREPALTARYAALRGLPKDTLGAALIDDLERSGFPLPGERGTAADWPVRHDLCHVLSGYDTDARSEVLAGSFMGGCRAKDGFSLIVFVLLQFHCGIRVTPIAPSEQGLFDPRRVLEAVRRSAFMTIDPSVRAWDYWQDFDQPLASIRERYRVAPREI